MGACPGDYGMYHSLTTVYSRDIYYLRPRSSDVCGQIQARSQVPTQGSAKTILLRSTCKIMLLATRTSTVLPLGTHSFVALA